LRIVVYIKLLEREARNAYSIKWILETGICCLRSFIEIGSSQQEKFEFNSAIGH
jgi:hypothetical protein